MGRRQKPTSFTPYEQRVRELLKETRTMPATVACVAGGVGGLDPLDPR